jgi:hypothetical protein
MLRLLLQQIDQLRLAGATIEAKIWPWPRPILPRDRDTNARRNWPCAARTAVGEAGGTVTIPFAEGLIFAPFGWPLSTY